MEQRGFLVLVDSVCMVAGGSPAFYLSYSVNGRVEGDDRLLMDALGGSFAFDCSCSFNLFVYPSQMIAACRMAKFNLTEFQDLLS